MAETSTSATIYRTAVYWGVRVGVGLMALGVILVQLHVMEGPNLIVLLSALILLLSEQGHDSTREFQKQLESARREIRKLSTDVDNLIENSNLELISLNNCITDMAIALRSVPDGESVLIEHFGLDMTDAWHFFEPILRNQIHFANVDYRLLMMSGDVAQLDTANEEVRTWASAASWSLDKIKRDVVSMLKDPDQKCRDVKFEARTYVSVPVVHGFRIVSPIKRCYVSLCRWGGTDYRRYDWGESQYHTIVGDPPNAASQDLLRIYNGYFKHFWDGGTEAWVLDNDAKPAGPNK
jgi:hypothetical protein